MLAILRFITNICRKENSTFCLYQAVFGNYVSEKAEFAVADDRLLWIKPDKYVALNNKLHLSTSKESL